LVLVGGDNFQIVRAELIGVDFLDAVDEFYWSSVAIFGKK
jgi:hypothetical protein